jgi:hemerythrin
MEIQKATQRLTASIVGHFAHEERLMNAARYGSLRWHKQAHNAARRRVGQFVLRIEQGDSAAGVELDHSSLIIYTIIVSSILYFQRNTTGAALISSKYW